MTSFLKTISKVNPFKPRHGSVWKTFAADTNAMVNAPSLAANIINIQKEQIERLVIKSGAFQENPDEKCSMSTVAFVVGSMAVGFGGVQLLERGISNGHTWLLIPCIVMIMLAALAQLKK